MNAILPFPPPATTGSSDTPPAGLRRIAIVTDAWAPQTNGVVRTLETTCRVLEGWGHAVTVISPDLFRSLPCPTYPEIRLALGRRARVGALIDAAAAQAIHIATEGPLGLAARAHCLARGLPFTTAYHTQFPQYLARRTRLSPALFWPYIRWFHSPAQRIMVATQSIRAELREHGLDRLHHWGRGVDLAQFSPQTAPPPEFAGLPRPIQLYVGRVAVEKNIAAFLQTRHSGAKVVVGDGPARAALARAHPDAVFLGRRSGAALAGCYAGADVFVFPSRTDTFGLVMIEALASGTPVAAHPVPGPRDIVTARTGALHDDLDRAIAAALTCRRGECAAYGASFGWDDATRQFRAGLVELGPARSGSDAPVAPGAPVDLAQRRAIA